MEEEFGVDKNLYIMDYFIGNKGSVEKLYD